MFICTCLSAYQMRLLTAHRCIYMIDPSSIVTVAARRALSSLPAKTRSETTVSYRALPDLVPDTSSGDESDEEDEGPLTMSPAEIRVVRRLSARCNVLPVIAHADSLTDEKLLAIKNASEWLITPYHC